MNQQQWAGVQINTTQDLKLKQYVDDLYRKYDHHKTGSLDMLELAEAFNEILMKMGINSSLSQEEAVQLMNTIDKSKDGKVQKPEFFQCMKILTQN